MENTSKGFKKPGWEDYYDLEGVENYNIQKTNDLFEDIDSKMMDGTNNTDNKLANRDFVNSSIAHMAANPRGNWANWSSVPSDPTQYPADADGNKKPSNNDYMVVQDMTGYTNPEEPSRTYEGTWRFTYIGEWDDPIPGGTKGKSGWKPIYQVNEKPLTQEQVDALNSGINSTKRTNYDAHLLNNNNPHQITPSKIGLGNVNNTSDTDKPVSTAQQTEINKKVNIAQGTQNQGKILGIGTDGNVVPIDPPQGGATPEQLATKLDKTAEVKKIAVVTEMPKAIDLYTLYLVVDEEGEWPGLKFTSLQADAFVGYTINGTIDKDIYTSTDGKTWTSWNGNNIKLNNGESIYVWNKTNTLSVDASNKLTFTMSGIISASGNCNSMIDFGEISEGCYQYMFSGCSNLQTAPVLPSTTLAAGCYYSMFSGCSNLKTAPVLPATTLADNCYSYMFSGCTSLTTIPDLPATTLAASCYSYMFSGCSTLMQIDPVPYLPATTLASGCYISMFSRCYQLSSIKLNYTGNFSATYFESWVDNVAAIGTLYYNGSDTTRGSSAIPQKWAVKIF